MPGRDKVLITGSSGMLGVDLWDELKDEYELQGLDIVVRGQRTEDRGQIVTCDICDKDETIKIISGIKPNVVIHAAAWTDVDGCELDKEKAYRINSKGAENIAIGCKKADAVLIYISTDFVFDGKKKTPYKESDRVKPLSVYGDSKLEGEKAIRILLKRYFILRTSWLYGKNGKNFVDTILKKAEFEKVLKVVDDQVGSPTYTKDLAKAIHALLGKIFTVYRLPFTVYGTYHVSNSGGISWCGYAREILRAVGSNTRVIPISSRELARPAKRPAMSMLDNSKFKKFAHFQMRRWDKALKDYIFQPG